MTTGRVLLAYGIIDGRQQAAAERFSEARAQAVPVATVSGRGGRSAATALAALLSEDQFLALADVALDLQPPWLRRQLLGLPLTEDHAERRHLLEALDAIPGYVPPQPHRRAPAPPCSSLTSHPRAA